MRLIAIAPENLNMAWKDVEKYIAEGVQHLDDKFNIADIKSAILMQDLTLWVVYNDEKKQAEGCLLTEIIDYPRMRCLSIFLLSGNACETMVRVIPALVEYATGLGCERIEFNGNLEWDAVLKNFGFEKVHIAMRLRIE